MSWWTMITKLESVITKPVELMTDWAKEPLRKWEFERQMEQKEGESELRMREKDHETDIQIKIETGKQRVESELRMKEEGHKSDLHIKKETEIVRILQEIEDLKKDKQFERMKATSEAILKYQKELSNITARQ